jgi:uncharacterized membrane protein YgcG
MSLPLLVSPAITKMLTAAIAVILLAASFTTINAQQQVQSEGGLTATLNGNSFTQGDTITVSGSVGERGPNSFVGIRVIDPRSEEVEDGFPAIAADNTFTYSFVAGEQGEFDLDDPMVSSGNYRTVVTYSPPSDNSVIEEVELVFEYSPTPDTAEPQGALTTDQLAAVQNGTAETRTFQSKNDSFRLRVSDGWVIQDVNNSGSALGIEGTQGYGILAQLCPEEGPQQQGATSSATLSTTNASDNTNNNSNNSTTDNSCQGAQQEVIHIIRYPGLETRIQQEANNVTIYHLQKLQEVGYSRIQIVNSTATTVNITDPQTNQSIATVPAKIVEMTYSTSSDPNETRLGYFILTSTRATLPNLGTIKGYAVFYEGNTTATATTTNSNTTSATATPEITTTTTAAASSSDSSAIPPPTPLPPVVEQVFDSFELIAAPEVAQAIAQQAAAALGEEGDEDNDDDDTGGADEGGDGGDGDDGADEEEDEGDGEGEGDDDAGGGGEEGGGDDGGGGNG